MALAHLVNAQEDELICDFAEYYHIYNYMQYGARYAATLTVGLPDASRTKRKLMNQQATVEQMLLATIADYTSLLFWSKTKDAEEGKNRPKSLLNRILGNKEEEDESNVQAFDSVDAFEEARAKLLHRED